MAQSPFEILRQLQVTQEIPSLRRPALPVRGQAQPFPGSTANDAADLHSFNMGMADETRGRLNAQGGTDPRLRGILSQYQGEVASSPLIQQQEEYDQFNQADRAARAEGFGSMGATDTTSGRTAAQSREIYKRQQKEQELGKDERVANIQEAGGLARQKVQSQGIIDQEKVGADARSHLGELLLSGGVSPNRRASISGVGSVGPVDVDTPPNSAFDALTAARTQYDNAKRNAPGGFSRMLGWGRDDTQMRKTQLDSAVQGYLGQLDPGTYSEQSKQRALQLYNNPDFDTDETTDQILSDPMYGGLLNSVDSRVKDQIVEILRTIRGK